MELPEEAQEVRLSREARPPREVLEVEVELPQEVGELWVAQRVSTRTRSNHNHMVGFNEVETSDS